MKNTTNKRVDFSNRDYSNLSLLRREGLIPLALNIDRTVFEKNDDEKRAVKRAKRALRKEMLEKDEIN